MTRLARCASVLLVSGCTSAFAGVIHWVWVAAVGLWAACLGIAGEADGCAVGAAGSHWSGDRWLSNHFNLDVHVRLDSTWVIFM